MSENSTKSYCVPSSRQKWERVCSVPPNWDWRKRRPLLPSMGKWEKYGWEGDTLLCPHLGHLGSPGGCAMSLQDSDSHMRLSNSSWFCPTPQWDTFSKPLAWRSQRMTRPAGQEFWRVGACGVCKQNQQEHFRSRAGGQSRRHHLDNTSSHN